MSTSQLAGKVTLVCLSNPNSTTCNQYSVLYKECVIHGFPYMSFTIILLTAKGSSDFTHCSVWEHTNSEILHQKQHTQCLIDTFIELILNSLVHILYPQLAPWTIPQTSVAINDGFTICIQEYNLSMCTMSITACLQKLHGPFDLVEVWQHQNVTDIFVSIRLMDNCHQGSN